MCPNICNNELIIGKEYTKKILSCLDNAKVSIDILMFVWKWRMRDPTSDVALINQAILRAVRRGVRVSVFCNFKGMAEHLNTLGINAKAWQKTKLMHAKGILIDDKLLVVGSHNLTEPAMNFNVEVSALLYDEDVCVAFKKYFSSLWLS